jgi:transcriptional regulator with XRE-family HTH domain
METKLAENIRGYRKQRGLTQEQLAEALGVTVGAVHKWEAKLSTPELNLITEMADFFDVSVDALLGYRMKDNSMKAVTDRLACAISSEDPAGIAEAEKALKRFPHSFDIVYHSAVLYMIFGCKSRDPDLLDRAAGLMREALLLLPRNAGQAIGETSLREYLSTILMISGQTDEAVELLKKHNTEGVYNDLIGMTLSLVCRKPEEAEPFLSGALLNSLGALLQTIIGKSFAYVQCGDAESAEHLLKWGLNMLDGVVHPGETGYPDQSRGYLYTLLSLVYLETGRDAEAREALERAADFAARFDAAPNYDARSFRFVSGTENYHLHYLLGRTAKDGITNVAGMIGNEKLTALWKEIGKND